MNVLIIVNKIRLILKFLSKNVEKKDPACKVCGSEDVRNYYKGVKGHYGLYDIGICNKCKVFSLLSDYRDFREKIIDNSDVRKMVVGYNEREGREPTSMDLFAEYDLHREKAFVSYMRYILREKQGGSILDIGCGNGYFLTLFHSGKWEKYGVDYNEKNVEEAKKKGLKNIYKMQFKDFKPQESFDVISMLEYIEHSEEPLFELKKAYSLLKREGFILIETGNIDSKTAMEKSNRWAYFEAAPDHKVFFSSKTIVNVLKMAGFNEVFFHGSQDEEVMAVFAKK